MSILGSLIKDLLSRKGRTPYGNNLPEAEVPDSRKRVLNVGGSSKAIPLPELYNGWEHVLLDIDSRQTPDILCDARELQQLPPAQFDAVYCSHNLEHYFRHEVPAVLGGFLHLLKDDGFAHIRVPDIGEVMRTVVQRNLDIDDELYQSVAGPISVLDVIYGYGREIEHSGNDFFAHKTGFTEHALAEIIKRCGFEHVYARAFPDILEIQAFAFKNPPREMMAALVTPSASAP